MTRKEVFHKIETERISQDQQWRDGSPIEGQYAFSAPHIILLEEQVFKLRQDWYGVKDEYSLRDRFVKVAAIAIRALEEITCTK